MPIYKPHIEPSGPMALLNRALLTMILTLRVQVPKYKVSTQTTIRILNIGNLDTLYHATLDPWGRALLSVILTVDHIVFGEISASLEMEISRSSRRSSCEAACSVVAARPANRHHFFKVQKHHNHIAATYLRL